jgi:hypothetical protein
MEHREISATVVVPPNTGIEGFVRTLRTILKRPRVQHIEIDARGKVTYRRWGKAVDEDGGPNNNFGVDLEDLHPYNVIRNSSVREFMPPPGLPAAVVAALMFDKTAKDQMHPLAFASGAETTLWEWFRFTTGFSLEDRDTFCGLPLLLDRQLPDTALLLCAGFGKDAAFVDTQVSYKVEMPHYRVPTTDVQVIP